MEKYSIKKNYQYMGQTFYKPKFLIGELSKEEKLFRYSIIPLILFTCAYEFLNILSFIFNQPLLPLPKLIPISDDQYRLFQLLFFPIIHIVDMFVFYIVLNPLSRLIKEYDLNSLDITYFNIFMWNTIGLTAFVIDLIGWFLPWEGWMFIHPVCGIIGTVYAMEFIHEQSGISRKKALAILLPSYCAMIVFRMLFIR